jgi:hypothetical protein
MLVFKPRGGGIDEISENGEIGKDDEILIMRLRSASGSLETLSQSLLSAFGYRVASTLILGQP